MRTQGYQEVQMAVSVRHMTWLRVLATGFALFVVATIILFVTGNPNLYPTVILIGNFLIPVVFVSFLYDNQRLSTLPVPTVVQGFVLGGVLGVLGASVAEPLLIPMPTDPSQGLSITSALLVGVIEEGCKILVVILLARRMQHTSEMNGLLMGAAVGMGFAALESTGYAFTTFLLSNGEVGASISETIVRGLLAPFNHGVWTGILGAVLFRDSGPKHFRLTVPVMLTFLFVALLHGLWDGLPRQFFLQLPLGFSISLETLLLSIVGIVVLVGLYRQSLRRQG